MRTTLNLDDDVARALKTRAVETGRTMTELVDEALRRMLAADSGDEEPASFRWTTVEGHLLPGVDLSDRDALYDVMEGRR